MTETKRTVSMANMSNAEHLKMRLYSAAKDDGVSPTRIFRLLEDALEGRIWEELGVTFAEMMERPWPDGVGLTREQILTFIKLPVRFEDIGEDSAKRAEWVRHQVRDLLNEPVGENGNGPGRGHKRVDNVNPLTSGGNSESYAIGRLKRDRPDLAEKVLAREMSANAGAIKAGFRRKTLTIPKDLEKAARTLVKHFDPDELYRAMVAAGLGR